jgi:heat shock protein HslJ
MNSGVCLRVLCRFASAMLVAVLCACGVPLATPTTVPPLPPPTATAAPTATLAPSATPMPTATAVRTATPVPTATPSGAGPTLPAGVWQLVRIEYMSGKVVTIDKPESYTVQFASDGRLSVKADCNSGLGAFQAGPEQLTISGVGMTKMACPAGSQGDLFVGSLANAASYRLEAGELTITLKYDGGDLVLRKAQ